MGPSHLPSCLSHPHHLVVGVCAFCLEERLLSLSQSDSPSELLSSDDSYGGDDEEGEYADDDRFFEFAHKKVCHDNAENVPPFGYRPPCVTGAHRQHRTAQKHHRAPYLGIIKQKVAEVESAHVQYHAEQERNDLILQQHPQQKQKKQKQMQIQTSADLSQATSTRVSNASEQDFYAVKHRLHDFHAAAETLRSVGGDDVSNCKKSSKRSSWFGSMKSKPAKPAFFLPTSPLQQTQQQGFFIDQLRSPLHYIISAGRKSSSSTCGHGPGGDTNAISRDQSRFSVDHSTKADHQPLPSSGSAVTDHYTMNQSARASKKSNLPSGNKTGHGSHSSWISSLFHRKKQKGRTSEILEKFDPAAKTAIELEAGRLSLDAAKLNMQMRQQRRPELEKGRQSLQAEVVAGMGALTDHGSIWTPCHGSGPRTSIHASIGHGMMQYAAGGESQMLQRCDPAATQGRITSRNGAEEHDAEGMEAITMMMMTKKNSNKATRKKQSAGANGAGSMVYGMKSPLPMMGVWADSEMRQQNRMFCEGGHRNAYGQGFEETDGHGDGDEVYGDGANAGGENGCSGGVARSKSAGGKSMRSYFGGFSHHSRTSKAAATTAAAMAT